ncbi:condensation domain-containing protein, partial [Staphylococcus epidermidis]|uniref:condensation domain-containing protein n=1 Tax=Staphylococcus epidermidis TaxID=1282 RepID=UPI001E4EDA25
EYATELFKEETINQMLSHYIVLLENLIDYSSKPIGQVNMMDNDEQELVLNTFNDTYEPLNNNKTIIEMFEEQVQ